MDYSQPYPKPAATCIGTSQVFTVRGGTLDISNVQLEGGPESGCLAQGHTARNLDLILRALGFEPVAPGLFVSLCLCHWPPVPEHRCTCLPVATQEEWTGKGGSRLGMDGSSGLWKAENTPHP